MAVSTIAAPAEVSTDARAAASLVVCLGSAFQNAALEQLAPVLAMLQAAMPTDGRADAGNPVVVGYPGPQGAAPQPAGAFVLQPYADSAQAHMLSVHPAGTWLSAYELLRAQGSSACLLLGGEAQSLHPQAVRAMLNAVLQGEADLALPRYALPSNQGLLNAAMLSPLSQGLYGAAVRFPLALDFAFSTRMGERMAAGAQRFTAANQAGALMWPVAEAVVAGYRIAEAAAGTRELPQQTDDLSQVLNLVAGSMFADIEAKAAFWQRTRPAAEIERSSDGTLGAAATQADAPSAEEIDELIQSFRNGYSNLHEIWSLVLPPNTLLGLKRLSAQPRASFVMPDALWVRTVYDFVLAHRLRTLSRGHLLGALTPLYLAWVASHLLKNGPVQEQASALARAFEADKPYLVSRWRWPDRFNP